MFGTFAVSFRDLVTEEAPRCQSLGLRLDFVCRTSTRGKNTTKEQIDKTIL